MKFAGAGILSPSQQARAGGLKSLSQVRELTGVSLQTLTNWHRDKPELFRIVLLGCLAAYSHYLNLRDPIEEIRMKDQHEKISGYRDLSQEEIDLMNEAKKLAEQCGELIKKLNDVEGIDPRNLALGRTNLQQGFMWTIRSIAKPTTFG